MTKRTAKAVWNGSVKEGSGKLSTETGTLKDTNYSFSSRFEDGEGTNPEELLGAAEAGCFSMALSLMLGEEGYEPEAIETSAEVSIEQVGGDFSITGIVLDCTASVPEIDGDEFQEIATKASKGCPVSKALAGTEITLNATLKSA